MTATNTPDSRPNPSSTRKVRSRFARICCCSVTSERDRDRVAVVVILEAEVLAWREPECASNQAGRERLLRGVERLHHRVVVAARRRDLVFGIGQLVLQLLEVLARAQLRIGLGDGEQPPERRARLPR